MPIMRPSSREIQISLLGGFSVTIDGEPVPDRWRLRKAKTLVKLLALAPSHRLHRDLVVDRLWPDMEPQLAANNLYQLAHSIRRVLGGGSITLGDDVVRLCPADGLTVDVDQFEQAASTARTATTSPRCNTPCGCGPARCFPKINTPIGQTSIGSDSPKPTPLSQACSAPGS